MKKGKGEEGNQKKKSGRDGLGISVNIYIFIFSMEISKIVTSL